MYSEDMQDEKDNPGFDASLTRALERRPEAVVPADFAARVRAALPAVRPARAPMQFGRTVAVGAAFVLAVALCLLAPHAVPTFGNLAFDCELVVFAELGGIAYWLAVRRAV